MSTALGRPASTAKTKGSPRGSGKTGAVWPQNYWCSDFDDDDTIEKRIDSVARFVAARENAFVSLLRSGGRAEVYVFVGIEDKSLGFILEPTPLAILGRLNIKLSFDLFPPKP
jgi:hypothetical protein